jgi:proteasome alpha subunit
VLGTDDSGQHLFETDPSGAFSGIYAGAIGSGKKEVESVFEKEYDPEASLEDAVQLAFKALKSSKGKSSDTKNMDIYYLLNKDKKLKKLSPKEMEEYLKPKKKG